MDAMIRLKPEELTESFFKQLQALAASASRVEIRLDGVDAANGLSEAQIQQRLNNIEEGRTVSFSKEELETYKNINIKLCLPTTITLLI